MVYILGEIHDFEACTKGKKPLITADEFFF